MRRFSTPHGRNRWSRRCRPSRSQMGPTAAASRAGSGTRSPRSRASRPATSTTSTGSSSRRSPAGARARLFPRRSCPGSRERTALDLPTSEARRLTRVLEILQADPVSLALAVEAVAEQLSSPSLTLAQVQEAAAGLKALQSALDARPNRQDIVRRAIRDLSEVTAPRDLRDAAKVADSVYALVDDVLAGTLMSVAYALHSGVPQGTALAASVVRRHDFGFGDNSPDSRVRTAWVEPVQKIQPGVPWHVSGSLLGLDLGLSSLALRRTSLGALPGPPTLRSADKDIFTKTVALLSVFRLRDTERDAIAAAIARGRERVDEACRPPGRSGRDRERHRTGRMAAPRRPMVARERPAAGAELLFAGRARPARGAERDGRPPRVGNGGGLHVHSTDAAGAMDARRRPLAARLGGHARGRSQSARCGCAERS